MEPPIETNCGIYKITNKLTNKIYVGSSISLKNRKKRHFHNLKNNAHNNVYLQRAYNKVKKEVDPLDAKDYFKWEILEELVRHSDKVLLKKEILEVEQRYIDSLKACYPKIGYNIIKIAGSSLGYKHSEKTKKLMREKRKHQTYTDEHRKNMSIANIGRKHSKESKEKMSLANKGVKRSLEFKEKCRINNVGRKHTKETITRMSEAHKGRRHTEESKKKMSEVQKDRILSEEHKSKLSNAKKGKEAKNKKKVLNLDTKEVFKSLTEAASYYCTSTSCILRVCKGQRKTANGYKWKYLD